MLTRLHEAIAAVAPIHGVSGAEGSVVIHFNGASQAQQDAANAVLAAFDWSQGAQDLWAARKATRAVGGVTAVRLQADRSTTQLAYQDVAGLAFELDEGAHYAFEFNGAYTTSVNTVGCWLAVNGPATSFLAAVLEVFTAVGAPLVRVAGNYDTGVEPTASGGATPLPFRIYGNLTTTAAGLFIVRFRAEVAGTVTVKRGSYGLLYGVG